MMVTTLNRIKMIPVMGESVSRLLAGLGKTETDDEPLPYARIVEIVGVMEACRMAQAEGERYAKEWRLFAVWCARQVPDGWLDSRATAAIDLAERYANGQATEAELNEVRSHYPACPRLVGWCAHNAGRAAYESCNEWRRYLAMGENNAIASRAKEDRVLEAATAKFLEMVA